MLMSFPAPSKAPDEVIQMLVVIPEVVSEVMMMTFSFIFHFLALLNYLWIILRHT